MNDSPAPNRLESKTELVRVFGVADRGMALGHIRGKLAFIPFAAPGDEVEVEVVREKRRYFETKLLRVVSPSAIRRDAACPHFGICGGCQWQHLPYQEQLDAKALSFRGFLKTRLRLSDESAFRLPIASPEEWGYRTRVGLKVRRRGDRVLVGFFAKASHRLVAVETCPVAHPAIRELLPALRGFLQLFPPAQAWLPQIDLQVDGNSNVWAILHLLRPLDPADRRSVREFFDRAGVAGAYHQAGRKDTLFPIAGEPSRIPFQLRVCGREVPMAVTPGGFVQANTSVNQAMVDEVEALAPVYRGRPALDLYCGGGNFTLPLAMAASEVVGVEGYPPAARDAARNARLNGLSSVRVLGIPAARALEELAGEGFRPDLVLLDPPREGAAESVPGLLALGPGRILYVSCAPPALARDLRTLMDGGYRLEWTRIADMFPQTEHVESLTLLARTH